MFRLHAKRVLFPFAISLTPIFASVAGCDWVDEVDHVSVPPDGGGGGEGGADGGGDATAGGPAAARFRLAAGATTPPSFLDVPFPSDVYLGSNGRIAPVAGLETVIPSPAGAAFVANDLQANNGFSRVAMSFFYVDDPSKVTDGQPAPGTIDKASLPATEADCKNDASSVFLVDLEATDPAQARIGCRAAFHTNSRTGSRATIAIGPARGLVLKEKHKYAAVLTNRVKDTAGKPLTVSTDFDRIRKGDRTGLAAVYGSAYEKATTVLGSALSGAEVVALAPFTTNSMADELFKLRETIDATPAPTIAWTQAATTPLTATRFGGTGATETWTATLDEYLGTATAKLDPPLSQDNPSTHLPVRAHDQLASISTAAFEAVSFLQAKSGGYTTPGHATFARKADGSLDTSVSSKAKIWATFAIPNKPQPADGYPIVIIQHGLNSSREYMFGLANAFAARGYATVAIDSVTFGARGVAPSQLKDRTSSYFGATGNDAKWGCPPLPTDPDCNKGDGLLDGSQPESTALFGGLINIGALRDQMRQAALDTTQLVRALRALPNGGVIPALKRAADSAAPKLDTTKIAYLGDSLGAIQGSMAAAIEPNVKSWVLNVGGAGLLVELATHSPSIFAKLHDAAAFNFGLTDDTLSESHPLISLLQTVADPGDPLNYADLLIKSPRTVGGTAISPRNILQFEVLYDEVVPNESNEALARAGGWGIASPNAGSNAGITDVKTLTGRNEQLLPSIAPDAEDSISKNMTEGVTAVVVQLSPSQHSSNLTSAVTLRSYAAPFARFDSSEPFPKSPAAGTNGYLITLAPQYLQLQQVVATFLADGFNGVVPHVVTKAEKGGFPAPIRDIDGDKLPDDTDPDPNVPKKP